MNERILKYFSSTHICLKLSRESIFENLQVFSGNSTLEKRFGRKGMQNFGGIRGGTRLVLEKYLRCRINTRKSLIDKTFYRTKYFSPVVFINILNEMTLI